MRCTMTLTFLTALGLTGCDAPVASEASDEVPALRPVGGKADDTSGKPRVLMVMSAADDFALAGGERFPAGVFLSEFAPTLVELEAAGYEVELASPGGVFPTIDAHGLDTNFYRLAGLAGFGLWGLLAAEKLRDDDLDVAVEWLREPVFSEDRTGSPDIHNALRIVDDQIRLARLEYGEQWQRPEITALEELAADPRVLDGYAGIYFPGGHAPKTDLMRGPASHDVDALLRYAHEHQIPTALICHAPAVLLATLPGEWSPDREYSEQELAQFPYRGYQITIGNVFEESLLESIAYLRGRSLEFKVQPEVEEVGLVVSSDRTPTQDEVVCDRELCTGANPASVWGLTDAFIEQLDAYVGR